MNALLPVSSVSPAHFVASLTDVHSHDIRRSLHSSTTKEASTPPHLPYPREDHLHVPSRRFIRVETLDQLTPGEVAVEHEEKRQVQLQLTDRPHGDARSVLQGGVFLEA